MRCLLHSWGRWRKVGERPLLDKITYRPYGTAITQERACRRCGLVRIKISKSKVSAYSGDTGGRTDMEVDVWKEVHARVAAGNIEEDFIRAQPDEPVMTTWGNTITCLLRVGDVETYDMSADERNSLRCLLRDAEKRIWDAVMRWKREHGLKRD